MTSAKRGPYAKSAGVRRNILEACVRLIDERGYHAFTMADLARAAEMSHTGVLHHYRDKTAVLTAVLDMQDARAELLMDSADEDDPLAAIVTVLRGLAAQRSSSASALAAVLAAEATRREHPAHEHFARRYERVLAFLSARLGRLAEEGRLAQPFTAERLARTVIAAVEGMQVQRSYSADVEIDTAVGELLQAAVPELGALEWRRHAPTADADLEQARATPGRRQP